jgi:hypothetical protein
MDSGSVMHTRTSNLGAGPAGSLSGEAAEDGGRRARSAFDETPQTAILNSIPAHSSWFISFSAIFFRFCSLPTSTQTLPVRLLASFSRNPLTDEQKAAARSGGPHVELELDDGLLVLDRSWRPVVGDDGADKATRGERKVRGLRLRNGGFSIPFKINSSQKLAFAFFPTFDRQALDTFPRGSIRTLQTTPSTSHLTPVGSNASAVPPTRSRCPSSSPARPAPKRLPQLVRLTLALVGRPREEGGKDRDLLPLLVGRQGERRGASMALRVASKAAEEAGAGLRESSGEPGRLTRIRAPASSRGSTRKPRRGSCPPLIGRYRRSAARPRGSGCCPGISERGGSPRDRAPVSRP